MKKTKLLAVTGAIALCAFAGYWGLNLSTGDAGLSNKRFPPDTLSTKDVVVKASSFPSEEVNGELLIYPPVDTSFVWDVEKGSLVQPSCSSDGFPHISISPTHEWLTELPPGSVGGQLFVTDAGESWRLGSRFVKDEAENYEPWITTNAIVAVSCTSKV